MGRGQGGRCGREDSNLHPSRDQDLNLARLPNFATPATSCDRSVRDPAAESGAWMQYTVFDVSTMLPLLEVWRGYRGLASGPAWPAGPCDALRMAPVGTSLGRMVGHRASTL
jgi:hypothetical protein